jgi:hypothetical protein
VPDGRVRCAACKNLFRPAGRGRVNPLKAFGEAGGASPAPAAKKVAEDDEPRIPKRVKVAAAALVAAVLLFGLFQLFGSGRPPVHPVRGQAFFEERPIAGGTIALEPTWEADPPFPRPHATLKDDGSFVLGTYAPEDGAPAGEYKVSLTWYEKPQGEGLSVRNHLPKKYAGFQTSGLTMRIAAGNNQLEPLRLAR